MYVEPYPILKEWNTYRVDIRQLLRIQGNSAEVLLLVQIKEYTSELQGVSSLRSLTP